MTSPEIRDDPITGHRVIVVPGRAARPNEHATAPPAASQESGCPFCEGNEGKTPPELAVIAPPHRAPNSPGWFIRTIPNRFPTVEQDDSSFVPSGSSPGSPDFPREWAVGHHEVVIESPSHSPLLPFLPFEQVVRALSMCRDRVRHLSRQERVGSVTLFENTGPESGGSLWHPHAQLVTLPSLTPALEEELEGIRRYCARTGTACAQEQVARAEARDGRRLLFDRDGLVGYSPFASEVPYESRITSWRHAASFGDLTDAEVATVASHLIPLLQALLRLLPGASYNLVVRNPVAEAAGGRDYHWHLDLRPRLVRPDGFDLGSGLAVNTVPPELAAEALRSEMGAKR